MKLIIVESVNDYNTFQKYLSPNTHILALDQSVMILLDKNGIKYKVIEDFYTPEEYYVGTHTFKSKVEALMSNLDIASEKSVYFPYAFSGNKHYLLTWFDDLYFLEKFINIIQHKYENIYLFSSFKPKIISKRSLSFSVLNSHKKNGTISFPTERTQRRKIELICDVIDVEFIRDVSRSNKIFPVHLEFINFINKVFGYIGRRIPKTNFFELKINNLKKETAYIIQDGHEVLYLKNYLSNISYLKPTNLLRKNIEREQPSIIINTEINNILDEFIRNNFSILGSYINLFMRSYTVEIVGRVKSFKEEFEVLIRKDKPSIFLLSAGTRDVFDSICCYVGNSYNIPVLIFQHGGHSLFTPAQYQESLEYPIALKNILVAQSSKEVAILKNRAKDIVCMGCIQKFESIQAGSDEAPSKSILFCLGPDVNLSFRQLLIYYSTNIKYRQSLDVMATVQDLSMTVDVKLHPSGEKNSYYCIKDVVDDNKYKNVNILYGSFGEVVSKNYQIIILDYIGSALTGHILSLKIPIIIYQYNFDESKLIDEVKRDLRSRCYIAKSKKELFELLERFKAGKLPSKWNENYIDGYLYPIKNGNPGANIANYIDNIIR